MFDIIIRELKKFMNIENIAKLNSIFISTLDLENDNNIEEITQLNFPKWDSLAQAILIAAVADEFSVDISGEEFEMFNSYKSVKLFLEDKGF